MGGSRRSVGAGEWVGGTFRAPFWVTEGEPYRPEVVLWVELPSVLVVAAEVLRPDQPAERAFGPVLRAALERPLAAEARRPGRIRVADPALADAVHVALGNRIEVVVAPTPELDLVFSEFARATSGEAEEASYLEGGRIPADLVADLFSAAAKLWRCAPWKLDRDTPVLRVDISALGVEGACLCILGQASGECGLALFPSLAAFDGFAAAADAFDPEAPTADVGTSSLSLRFERGADLPASLRREVADYGWPVAGSHAYPIVEHRERDGMPRPLEARDVRITTACAAALPPFFARHREIFDSEEFAPVSDTVAAGPGVEVRLSAPCDELLLAPSAPDPAAAVGRNEPCPCGSGKKYKRCHLPLAEDQRARGRRPSELHALDRRVLDDVVRFAQDRFPLEFGGLLADFADAEAAAQLSIHWAVWHARIDGRAACDWFLIERARRLSAHERDWIESQRGTWLSVWEVTAVEPGVGVELDDLLTGERRSVSEVEGSRTLAPRDALLARVVDHEELSLLCGVHPRALPPREAAEVVRRVRARLRRQREIPAERLRQEEIGRYLIARWEEGVAAFDARRSRPLELHNTEGDPVLLTCDHFLFDPGRRDEIEARIAALPGVEAPDPGDSEHRYDFLRDEDPRAAGTGRTLWGSAILFAGALRLETNSVRRADQLRALVERACPARLRHRAREHTDPRAPGAADGGPVDDERAPELERELERLAREWKQRHYAAWVDEPLPALRGKTPRQAAGTREGRRELDVLLKELENGESRLPAGERIDVGALRRELDLR